MGEYNIARDRMTYEAVIEGFLAQGDEESVKLALDVFHELYAHAHEVQQRLHPQDEPEDMEEGVEEGAAQAKVDEEEPQVAKEEEASEQDEADAAAPDDQEEEEEEQAEPDNYNYLSTRACDLVLEHLCVTGQASTAFKIFKGMGHIVLRSTLSYNTMIRGLGMHGKVSMARELFDTMLPFGTVVPDSSAASGGNGQKDIEDDDGTPPVPARDQDSYDFMVDAYFKKMESDPDSLVALEALMAEMKSTNGLRVNTWPFGKALPGLVPIRKTYAKGPHGHRVEGQSEHDFYLPRFKGWR